MYFSGKWLSSCALTPPLSRFAREGEPVRVFPYGSIIYQQILQYHTNNGYSCALSVYAEEPMSPDDKKKAVAEAALQYVESGWVVGVGTGSTADHFIDALARIKGKLDGAVASSVASAERLKKHGIQVLDLNATGDLPLYVDGTDEATKHLHLVKGGGGALAREKIAAAASKKFVCI